MSYECLCRKSVQRTTFHLMLGVTRFSSKDSPTEIIAAVGGGGVVISTLISEMWGCSCRWDLWANLTLMTEIPVPVSMRMVMWQLLTNT